MFPIFDSEAAKPANSFLPVRGNTNALLAAIICALCAVSDTSANENNRNSASRVTEALFPASPNYILVSYSLTQENLAIHDEVPLLRIYGDGRVHVHRPEYLKHSGDYQMRLTSVELQTLCLEMMQKNIMAYQDQTVDLEIAETEHSSQVSHHVSDDVHSSIELNLHGVKVGEHDNAEAVGKRKHNVSNIQAKAQFYPNIQLIGDLAQIEERLNQMIYDARLQAIQ